MFRSSLISFAVIALIATGCGATQVVDLGTVSEGTNFGNIAANDKVSNRVAVLKKGWVLVYGQALTVDKSSEEGRKALITLNSKLSEIEGHLTTLTSQEKVNAFTAAEKARAERLFAPPKATPKDSSNQSPPRQPAQHSTYVAPVLKSAKVVGNNFVVIYSEGSANFEKVQLTIDGSPGTTQSLKNDSKDQKFEVPLGQLFGVLNKGSKIQVVGLEPGGTKKHPSNVMVVK